MSTTRTGRDGRPLVDTAMAAYSLGQDRRMTPKQFRDWARRRHITPVDTMPNPRRGQRLALWDLADISDAVRADEAKRPTSQAA
ncbi:hypothetical protein [Streptomyces sp. G1]|uniref:hypothetical protein n=1 Tax=Streptomyces sp. G1 TaxID=361572 RepID=UPI00202FF80C|nr:hypothetical protein [Streptomyces sp. G1]MCM1972312.1 hypothetical protein [Streptomyces sp. G1]